MWWNIIGVEAASEWLFAHVGDAGLNVLSLSADSAYWLTSLRNYYIYFIESDTAHIAFRLCSASRASAAKCSRKYHWFAIRWAYHDDWKHGIFSSTGYKGIEEYCLFKFCYAVILMLIAQNKEQQRWASHGLDFLAHGRARRKCLMNDELEYGISYSIIAVCARGHYVSKQPLAEFLRRSVRFH